MNTLKR
jgi:hypothetical protein